MISRNELKERHREACDEVLIRMKDLQLWINHISERIIMTDQSLTGTGSSICSSVADIGCCIETASVLRSLLAERENDESHD